MDIVYMIIWTENGTVLAPVKFLNSWSERAEAVRQAKEFGKVTIPPIYDSRDCIILSD